MSLLAIVLIVLWAAGAPSAAWYMGKARGAEDTRRATPHHFTDQIDKRMRQAA